MDEDAILGHLGPQVVRNYPLAKLTSFKVGGPADFFATARSESQLVELVRGAWKMDLPLFIMGNGSNVLLSDKGVRGLVIRNLCTQVHYEERLLTAADANQHEGRPATAPVELGGAQADSAHSDSGAGAQQRALIVDAESGVMLPRLAREAIKRGYHDLVYATGIPGTVGGAVTSNAGAYAWCLGDNLESVRYLARDGCLQRAQRAALALGYRHSRFKETGEVVLAAQLRLTLRKAPASSSDLNRKRRDSQPLTIPNAGSMFKNPPGEAAGRLIEQAGLKGRRIGNAQISEKHANFIVNLGGARAADVLTLIQLAQREVKPALELEVQLAGDWS